MGSLTCRDCGLTFTAHWGPSADADEYRCERDHVVEVDSRTGIVLTVDRTLVMAGSLASLRGCCPRCSSELASGLLPLCPVCGGRDHDVLLQGTQP